ncbi:uncharacterized protein LOC111641993 [Centruroides sculpturatus]|uniref:uncharacterized protein LOC111641993 n=1 Tax=Centruroides sculpturatus TaxID=218467 RepID=UPI000C6EA425|nr:uncharacterized protein LOC111641993 [Centruroides sculpturatus]
MEFKFLHLLFVVSCIHVTTCEYDNDSTIVDIYDTTEETTDDFYTTESGDEIIERMKQFESILNLLRYPAIVLQDAFQTMFFKTGDLKPTVILDSLVSRILPLLENEDKEVLFTLFTFIKDYLTRELSFDDLLIYYNEIEPALKHKFDILIIALQDLNAELLKYNAMDITPEIRAILQIQQKIYSRMFYIDFSQNKK